jgi:hypothetical protein
LTAKQRLEIEQQNADANTMSVLTGQGQLNLAQQQHEDSTPTPLEQAIALFTPGPDGKTPYENIMAAGGQAAADLKIFLGTLGIKI